MDGCFESVVVVASAHVFQGKTAAVSLYQLIGRLVFVFALVVAVAVAELVVVVRQRRGLLFDTAKVQTGTATEPPQKRSLPRYYDFFSSPIPSLLLLSVLLLLYAKT